MNKLVDETGRRYGHLCVVGRERGLWRCMCDCGNIVYTQGTSLRRTGIHSCGCAKVDTIRAAKTKHGAAGTRPYGVWKAMHARCYNPNNSAYKNYGERGIQVCVRWEDYGDFLADMGLCPPGLSLERLDNNKDYAPGNCYWATRLAQNNNTRNNRLLSVGALTQTLACWGRDAGIGADTIRQRITYGWPVEAACTLPLMPSYEARRKGSVVHINSLAL